MIPPENTPSRLLTMGQLSAKLGGRSRTSIYRDVTASRLPSPLHIGGRIYWREFDIDNAVNALAHDAA